MQRLACSKRHLYYCSGFVTRHAIRRMSSMTIELPQDFTFFRDFFTIPEQRILLTAALRKLDLMDSRQLRRRRKDYSSTAVESSQSDSIQSLFLPDEYYGFEEGHYDGVIKRFREMHVTSWPEVPGLAPLLERLHKLHPDQETQTHFLHLASDGEILAHVDNLEASGSWILGIPWAPSVYCALRRVYSEVYFRSNPPRSHTDTCGRRDTVRYGYQHSILKKGIVDGVAYDGGQRLSIMIRDHIASNPNEK
ncbi:hypothetical protein A0H81_04127, partial [Grifola frondosa]